MRSALPRAREDTRVLGVPLRVWVVALAATALAARLAYWAYAGTRLGGDSTEYLGACQRLAADPLAALRAFVGLEYVGFTGPLCAFLALTGGSLPGWVGLQMLLGTGACLLVFDAGRRLVSPAGGLAAGFALALAWEALQWDVYVLSDSLFLSVLALAVRSLAVQRTEPSPRHALAAAGALALVAVSRPVGVPLVLAWLAFDLLPRGHRARLGLAGRAPALATMVLLVLLVATQSGRGGWLATVVRPDWAAGALVDQDPAFTYHYTPVPGAGVLGFALANLGPLLVMGVLKALLLFLPAVPRFSAVHVAANALTLVPTMALGLLGAATALRRRPDLVAVLVAPAAVLVLVVAATFVDWDWRYRAPLVPLLAVLAGYALAEAPALAGVRSWLAARVPAPARPTPEGVAEEAA